MRLAELYAPTVATIDRVCGIPASDLARFQQSAELAKAVACREALNLKSILGHR
jgi:hypothetical protein